MISLVRKKSLYLCGYTNKRHDHKKIPYMLARLTKQKINMTTQNGGKNPAEQK